MIRQLVLVWLVAVAPLSAQRAHKGVPCGNSYISAGKTCHVGTPAQSTAADSIRKAQGITPAMTTTTSATTGNSTSIDSGFVASFADSVVFLASCQAAKDLAPANRRYFKTEEQAIAAGYQRSRTAGC